MIEQIFYATGAMFFSVTSIIIIRFCLWCRFCMYNKMETTITQPPTANTETSYRDRLVKARVKTAEDLNKMSDEDIKKLYLKHEQSVVDGITEQVSRMFVKTWTQFVSLVLPISDEDTLEEDLNKNVFLNAAAKEVLPSLYYDYGVYFAPFSVLLTTASHVSYQEIGNYVGINGRSNQEPKEVETNQDFLETGASSE